MIREWFSDMFIDLYENFSAVFISIIVFVAAMLVGFIAGWMISWLIEKMLILFRFDKWADEVGIIGFLKKGGVKTQPSRIARRLIFWVVVITFFSWGLSWVGVTQFAEYASRITSALPYVVISTIIVIVGIIFSSFLSRVIYLTCENANVAYGKIISKSVRILLIIITFGIVFEYMGIGGTMITISFLILFGGIVMTLSLALGIGLSTIISDFIKKKVDESHKHHSGNEDRSSY
jgi:hypothetical protein